MNVTLRQLRTFLVVAQTRHFRLAAERLHLTQPAISRHVADLEAELGLGLFDRNTREVHLTAAGERLQGALAPLLDQLDTLLTQTHAESEGLRGTVRMAAGPTPSAELVPPCLARCARDYPELRVLSRDRVQTEVIAAVLAGDVDFGMAIDPPASRELHVETVLHDPFVLVCRHDHPLAALSRVGWKRLRHEPLILLDHSSGSRRLIDAAFAEHQIDVQPTQETGHTHTAFRMVAAGLGCTVTPGLSAPLTPQLVTRPLMPVVRRAVTLVRRKDRSLTPAAERVWTLMREVSAERGG
ncbi:MAG TPA: LysR family transcriptional regulator [Oleiagrimonas sp.]|nr:LysR family transcriptional regulator [Oleiagrimonas sp.]